VNCLGMINDILSSA